MDAGISMAEAMQRLGAGAQRWAEAMRSYSITAAEAERNMRANLPRLVQVLRESGCSMGSPQ